MAPAPIEILPPRSAHARMTGRPRVDNLPTIGVFGIRTRYSVAQFVSSPGFRIVGVPILLMMVGLFAQRLGRRDNDPSPRRNDWAVATTVLLMALGVVLDDLWGSVGSKVTTTLAWLIGLLVAIFFSIDHDRYGSWLRTPDGKPTDRKSVFLGIFLPNLLSLIIFWIYQKSSDGHDDRAAPRN